MIYQVLFSLKNNEKYSRLSSAAAVIGAVRVNFRVYNSYAMVCPPARGDNPRDNPRALASGLSPEQADKQWYI